MATAGSGPSSVCVVVVHLVLSARVPASREQLLVDLVFAAIVRDDARADLGRAWCHGCQRAVLAAQFSTPSGESTR